MSLQQRRSIGASPILNSEDRDYYAHLPNLTLVARSSHRTIGTALEVGFATNQIETASYLLLCLCFQEYCHSTNLAVRFFGTKEFEAISRAYNNLEIEHPDRHLLMFCGAEIKPILERVGASIRSLICDTNGIDCSVRSRDR